MRHHFTKKKYPKEYIRVDKEDPIFSTFMEVIIIFTAENLSKGNEEIFAILPFDKKVCPIWFSTAKISLVVTSEKM